MALLLPDSFHDHPVTLSLSQQPIVLLTKFPEAAFRLPILVPMIKAPGEFMRVPGD